MSIEAKIAQVQIEKATSAAMRAIQFSFDTLSGTRKIKDVPTLRGSVTNIARGAVRAASAARAEPAMATFARITPQAGQAAGADWSCGKDAWPHLGQ